MPSNTRDVKEYIKYTTDGIVGNTTRGIVVSNVDPLFSGRVKVWIPTLHGGFDEPGNKDPLIVTRKNPVNAKDTEVLAGSLASLSKQAIETLPWAIVLGHNWGSIGKFAKTGIGSEVEQINYGLFSTPRIGTEVILIFENDDPNFPIIVGSCIQSGEYLWNRKLSLELMPGVRAAPDGTKSEGDYAKEVANSFIIQSANGSRLMFSDSLNREAILLTAPIYTVPKDVKEDPKDRNKLRDQSTDYTRITNAYPGFPSTASAPYMSTPAGSSTFVNGVIQTSAVFFDPPPSVSDKASENTSPADGTPPAPLPPATPPEERVEKTWPVEGTPAEPKGNQMFGAPRSYGKHVGIDLSEPVGAPLLAPIDGVVLYFYFSIDAGNILAMKGKDGSIHQFDHLLSVDKSKIGREVKIREQIGVCGNTGGASTGPHLHWDVVLDPDNLTETAVDARNFRHLHIKGGTFRGVSIAPWSFTNPLEWLKNGSGVVTVTNTQLQAVVQTIRAQDTFNNLPENERYRSMGLEMSLVTGRETLFLRHPSGSYMGFDVDGNFMLYTTGDANFKVGRSANWNVFGGFLVDCATLWHKVSHVARLFAMSFNHSKHIKDEDVASASIPEFFKRNVIFKKADMNNALAASQSNTWLIDNRTGQPVGTLGDATGSTPDSGAGPSTSPLPSGDKLVWGSKYNPTIGGNSYEEFKKKVREVSSSLGIDPNWLMAVMMAESELEPSKRNISSGAIGLIQFTTIALTQMKETRSKADIGAMNAVSQMDLVQKYFESSNASGKMKSVEDVYAMVFWPAALGRPDDYIIATRGDSKTGKAYEQNKGLDLDKNGIITRKELTQRATTFLENGKNFAK